MTRDEAEKAAHRLNSVGKIGWFVPRSVGEKWCVVLVRDFDVAVYVDGRESKWLRSELDVGSKNKSKKVENGG